MEHRRKGVYLLLGGVGSVIVGAVANNPSTPLSSMSKIWSLTVLVGIILIIWGTVELKRAKEKAMKEKRRSMDSEPEIDK